MHPDGDGDTGKKNQERDPREGEIQDTDPL